jgi:hypothetical protein
MPLVTERVAVAPSVLSDPGCGWRRMLRIQAVGANVSDVISATVEFLPERLVFAEGDSWFDKFTPFPMSGTNLLDTIRTPFLTAVIDVAHIGDESRDIVRGHQAQQTRAMFDLFDFDAILLSTGGNDLKNVFTDMFAAKALTAGGFASKFQPKDLDKLSAPVSFKAFFADVIRNIGRFVDLRRAAKRQRTRAAPIFLHGYDYLQPRPAGAAVFAGSRIGGGPWLFPALQAAGLSDAQMRATADSIVDEMNTQLQSTIAVLPNVHVIDQRGLLAPAAPGTLASHADWLDEIHPNVEGFAKLARNCWDVPVARALGWVPQSGDLIPAIQPTNASTARVDEPSSVS